MGQWPGIVSSLASLLVSSKLLVSWPLSLLLSPDLGYLLVFLFLDFQVWTFILVAFVPCPVFSEPISSHFRTFLVFMPSIQGFCSFLAVGPLFLSSQCTPYKPVFWIRMFLGLQDPESDQSSSKNVLSLQTQVNVHLENHWRKEQIRIRSRIRILNSVVRICGSGPDSYQNAMDPQHYSKPLLPYCSL